MRITEVRVDELAKEMNCMNFQIIQLLREKKMIVVKFVIALWDIVVVMTRIFLNCSYTLINCI